MIMEMTVPAVARENDITIPLACIDNRIQYRIPKLSREDRIDSYVLKAPMSITDVSELWFAQSRFGEKCIIKCTRQHADREVLAKIQSYDSPHLVQILKMGVWEDFWYEIYPFYKNGSLQGRVSENTIKDIVVPSLIKALNVLHNAGIAHNDIKPSNLFWDDHKKKVMLGDFGCATTINEKPRGFTPSYAAPELLGNGPAKKSSDWCSVGLTLASLYDGHPLIKGESIQEIRYIWESGVRFQCESREFRQLINGMLNVNPRKRLGPKAAASWCQGSKFGSEVRGSNIQDKTAQYVTIKFENPSIIATDIDSLLQAIASHWQHAAFLFRQKQFDRFLDQFDKKWIASCKEIRRIPDNEDALFMLTLELTDMRFFIWRGEKYQNLLELEREWERGSEGKQNVVTMLQRGLINIYLEKSNASKEQLDYVKRLQSFSHYQASEACLQLFQALKGQEGFRWKGSNFNSLHDLASWLEEHTDTLDMEISDLFEDKQFGAWFEYQGMEGILDQIRRRSNS